LKHHQVGRTVLFAVACFLAASCGSRSAPAGPTPIPSIHPETSAELLAVARVRMRILKDPLPDPGGPNAPTLVFVTRLPGHLRLSPLSRDINNPDLARQIYTALLAEPPLTESAPLSCADSNGVTWRLYFSNASGRVVDASVLANGCEDISLTKGAARRVKDRTFWFLLAKALDLPVADMHPTASS
jgi:hypothetical protein